MIPRPDRALAAALALLAGGAAGAEEGVFSAPSPPGELAAHRALARVRSGDASLAPFSTDGCSGGLSAVWSGLAATLPAFGGALGDLPPWEACCVAHDRRYHAAGPDPDPAASRRARLEADEALRACVVATGAARAEADALRFGVSRADLREGYALVARAMFLAVRYGGGPCSGLPWRWGYGWPQCLALPADFAGD